MSSMTNSLPSCKPCAGPVCTIVPTSLLVHIRDAEAASPRARNAAARTLAHTNAFQAQRARIGGSYSSAQAPRFRMARLGHKILSLTVEIGVGHPATGSGVHGPQHSIVPPHILQAIIDSEDASPSDKERAQNNLGISTAIRAARGGGGGAGGTQVTGPSLHRILYNARKHSHLPGKEVREEGEDMSAIFMADNDFKRVWDTFGDTYNFYWEVFKRNSIDDKGMRLIGTVHYDDDDRPPGFDNAFWSDKIEQMVFGDGDGDVFSSFTGAIDVIAHELTHGVTAFTANLPYHRQSGALNESISDVFGSMVKQYVLKQTADEADWLIGEGIFVDKVKNPALRSMAKPGTAFHDIFGAADDQPSHMDNYDDSRDAPENALNQETGDHGGVHKNSGIPNHAFYLVATKLGGNSWDKAGPIWYKSLRDPTLLKFAQPSGHWMEVFKFFAELTVKYAESDAAVVEEAWKKVGVLP